ncbi:MAG: carbon-nitrogen hydrolase family protein [Deltaproteobacteria bacterium]|nr:carbon-nitrogen hydrolase family protein [Deltaproteobacteria bacterium]
MKVAAIQAASVFLDRKATTDKALRLMREAASEGAQLCAFPEAFVSGYPVWIGLTDGARFNNSLQKEAFSQYLEGSVRADGPELKAVAEEAKKLGLFTYLGVLERSSSGSTIYCSLAAIHPDKGIVSIHRKLMPTFDERLVWGTGDGHGLKVHQWGDFKVGGLNCWENWMPLARYTLYAQGENLHVATWPGAEWLTRDITRFIALEGRMYVVSAGGVLTEKDIPDWFSLKEAMLSQTERFLEGGTFIVGPDGKGIAGPIKGEETIVYADIDMGRVREERQNFDPAGHYNRPDVFSLTVSRERLEAVRFQDDAASSAACAPPGKDPFPE